MVAKKSAQANLENKKNLYMMMGFVMVLSLLYISFEWSKAELNFDKIDQSQTTSYIDELPPITMPDKVLPPPPPPPPLTDIINVVKDEVKTTEQIFTDDTPIETLKTYATSQTAEIVEQVDEVLIYVEQMPEFEGDVFSYLAKALKYPTIPQEYGIQGRVVCQFVVNKDGSIVDIQVVKSIDKYLDAEAVRVIKLMPKWKPGKLNGKAVRVKYTLPVHFKLM